MPNVARARARAAACTVFAWSGLVVLGILTFLAWTGPLGFAFLMVMYFGVGGLLWTLLTADVSEIVRRNLSASAQPPGAKAVPLSRRFYALASALLVNANSYKSN